MTEANLNVKFIDFVKLLNIYLNHFPKHEKFALSNRIRNTVYELYDLISEGQKKYYKKTTLTNLDIIHEKLRMQLHLANEMGYFSFKNGKAHKKKTGQERFLTISLKNDEIGKMIGGWIKKIKEDNKW